MFILFQKLAITALGILILIPVRGNQRRRATRTVALGLFAEALCLAGVQHYQMNPEDRFVLWLLALPLVFAGTGVVELLSGQPFSKEAKVWNGLDSSRQSSITLLVIALTVAVIVIVDIIYTKLYRGLAFSGR